MEFTKLKAKNFPKKTPKTKVYDCWRLLRSELEKCPWVDYVPFGVGERKQELEELLRELWMGQSHS
jgi:hypothetical protein